MAKLYRKNNKWYIDYRLHGRRCRKCLGNIPKTEAERILLEVETQKAQEKVFGKPILSNITLGEALEEYLKYSKARHSRQYAQSNGYRAKRLIEWFGENRLLRDISPIDIENFLYERTRKCGPCTFNSDLMFLKSFFNRCVEWEYISSNPAARIKQKKRPPGRLRYLSENELRRLMQELEKEPLHWRALFLTALHTGMRKGEVINLKWGDVDFAATRIIVQNSKNNEKRIIPMTSTLKNILQELYNLQQKTTGCVSPVDYVFVNPENGRRITAPGSRFRKLLKRARIKDFRFHDMRHNFASYLAMNNVDIRTIQELLGHKDIKMTIRYSHLSSRALEQAVRKFNDYVEEKLDASENKEEDEKVRILRAKMEVRKEVKPTLADHQPNMLH